MIFSCLKKAVEYAYSMSGSDGLDYYGQRRTHYLYQMPLGQISVTNYRRKVDFRPMMVVGPQPVDEEIS